MSTIKELFYSMKDNVHKESDIIEQQKLFEIAKLFISDIIYDDKIDIVIYFTLKDDIYLDYRNRISFKLNYDNKLDVIGLFNNFYNDSLWCNVSNEEFIIFMTYTFNNKCSSSDRADNHEYRIISKKDYEEILSNKK